MKLCIMIYITIFTSLYFMKWWLVKSIHANNPVQTPKVTTDQLSKCIIITTYLII